MTTAEQGTALTVIGSYTERDAASRRRAQGRGIAQTRDGGKFRPPEDQNLKQTAGTEVEEGAKHRSTSSKSVLVGGGTELSGEAMEEALRKCETEATGLARGEPAQGTSDGGRRNPRRTREGQQSSVAVHQLKETWCRAIRTLRGREASRGGGRISKTKKACIAELGSDIWGDVRGRIAVASVQAEHTVKMSSMRGGARGESARSGEDESSDTHVQREVMEERQGQKMRRAGEDGRCTNSTPPVEGVCADNRLLLSVAAMSLTRAERGAVVMSLSKRRQAVEVNKLVSAAEDLESRKGGRLQAIEQEARESDIQGSRRPSSTVRKMLVDRPFQDLVMQRVGATVVDLSAKGGESTYDRRVLLQSIRARPASTRTGQVDDAIMITPNGEVEYDDETGDTMAVDESRRNVEGSGVDLSAPDGGGCHVDRGRSAK